jgi:hypothetical protein
VRPLPPLKPRGRAIAVSSTYTPLEVAQSVQMVAKCLLFGGMTESEVWQIVRLVTVPTFEKQPDFNPSSVDGIPSGRRAI